MSYELDKQKELNSKEAKCITALSRYCKEHHIQFADVHNNWSSGIDVFINRIGYDLKVTNKDWIDVQKVVYRDGLPIMTEYPLETHVDTDYLIAREVQDSCYDLYLLKKFDLFKFSQYFPFESYPEYYKVIDNMDSLDGNYHVCLNFSRLLSKEPLYKCHNPKSVNNLFGLC